jgi:hypothetical protein
MNRRAATHVRVCTNTIQQATSLFPLERNNSIVTPHWLRALAQAAFDIGTHLKLE